MILYALPPCSGGVGQGEVPRPHAGNGRSMFTSLIARCPVAMGWGMGVYSPFFFWHWSPFTKSPWWSQGTGGPKAEVKMVLSRKKSCSPRLPAGHPQDEYEAVSVVTGMSSGGLYPAGSRGQTMSPGLKLSTELLSGGVTVPQSCCLGCISSSQESSPLADALTSDPCSWSPGQTVVTLMTTSRPD